jgi:hypothetical protein
LLLTPPRRGLSLTPTRGLLLKLPRWLLLGSIAWQRKPLNMWQDFSIEGAVVSSPFCSSKNHTAALKEQYLSGTWCHEL